jgi:hypothetical protein
MLKKWYYICITFIKIIMKTLLTAFATLALITCFSQNVEYRSAQLDSLVWEKINQRLVTLGNNPIEVFENGEMKDFSVRVCERLLPKGAHFSHSDNDSISKYSGGECIYTYELTSTRNNRYIAYLKNGDLDKIAQNIVDGWVGSDSHRRAISKDWYDSTTVSVIVIYSEKEGYFKLAAAWHEKDSIWGSVNQ